MKGRIIKIILYLLLVGEGVAIGFLINSYDNKYNKLEKEYKELKEDYDLIKKNYDELNNDYNILWNTKFDDELYQCQLDRDYWYYKYTGQDWRLGA